MGRSHLYTMHQAKIIVAQGGARLGEKQYISIEEIRKYMGRYICRKETDRFRS